MEKNIDFIELGRKKAEDDLDNFKRFLDAIKEEYGEEAKTECEIGYKEAIADIDIKYEPDTKEELLDANPRNITR